MNRRQELLNDITDTVGSAFLGITVGCARCHDHKFDPILHKDYYRLQAFFVNTRIEDEIPLDTAEQRQIGKRKSGLRKKTKAIRDGMESLLAPARVAFTEERLARFPKKFRPF